MAAQRGLGGGAESFLPHDRRLVALAKADLAAGWKTTTSSRREFAVASIVICRPKIARQVSQ